MASSPAQPLLRLLRYGQPYRVQVWGALICSIFRNLLDLAPPYLIGVAIDVVIEQENSLIARLGVQDPLAQLVVLSLLTIATWGLESLSQYGADKLWRDLAQTVQHELRVDTYNHLQELELAYFEDHNTGALLSILNDDINQLERFLNFGAQDLISFFTRVLAVGFSFVFLAPGIAWLAMLPIPFILWGTFAFQSRLAPRYDDVRDQAGLISDRLSNNLSGMATIKSFTAEAYERDRVYSDSEAYRRGNSRAIALSVAFQPLIRFLILLGFVLTLYLGGREVLQGRLTAGTYGFMVFIVQDLLWPFTELSEIMDDYQRAMASVRRVMGLLGTAIAIPTGTHALPLHQVRGAVQFDNITFAYNDRNSVLKQLSLHVAAGATIGIVGATGSGKSTLVKLLLRFYDVQNGRILIDGIDIRELHLLDLRRCIGWVSQDVFLFQGTVAENIRYGSFNATREHIVHAAKQAEAHEFIEQLPQGYETIVGERGQKLSGGQRQRLAIARAILKDPPILVLDEATSAVDNETEVAIQRSLAAITQGRTTIAIAHRLSTIRNAGCIYVMENGHIVEQGTHEELLRLHGIYARLWRVQLGSEFSDMINADG
ncbi:ATP-binding cassette domain-containing protein [Synechococcales cyanobacterium C]|uniref:ATP-binding cassette domain-containing protein n=1 Tax=Petrachloros mirabilis ULC683 TaxID=2781853 RepID=A0A8K2A0M1_9CYAN|nr:ABC transporter ATP-binding protein [Petrachloros mirabilis]NCJ08283.1 ATP-binding cassette domain-containing protein [Petrachloros mirabilis ULC683]